MADFFFFKFDLKSTFEAKKKKGIKELSQTWLNHYLQVNKYLELFKDFFRPKLHT